MQDVGNFSDTVAVLACALGCGLLMGIERERRKGSGPGRGPAGIRTFSIASLAGGVAAVLGSAPQVADLLLVDTLHLGQGFGRVGVAGGGDEVGDQRHGAIVHVPARRM